MRAFLAFEIASPVKDYLQGVIGLMASRIPGVKWIKRDGQHITLKFFGNIEERMAHDLREKLKEVEEKFRPFEATLKDIDAFPSRRKARVIVVTLEKGVDFAKAIFHDIERVLTTFGVEREQRAFIPHITLGRKREPSVLFEKELPVVEEMSFIIDRVVLFRSTLTPQGAIYSPVWEIVFKGGPQAMDNG